MEKSYAKNVYSCIKKQWFLERKFACLKEVTMSGEEHFEKAQKLFLEGKHKESIDAFTEAIEAGEKKDITYLSRGVAYFQLKDFDNAIADFGKAIEVNDKNVRAYYYRGVASSAKGDHNSAIPDYDKAIELKPDHGAAFFARGSAYAQLGNDDEATKNIKTALIYSESAAQGFADTIGMFRTQFDDALAIMSGERKSSSITLDEKEAETLKKWIRE
jgi:tetratricopeptide (TPR) repeat protein